MNAAGIMGMVWGALFACSRGLLMVAPGVTLRGFRVMIKTHARTRVFGGCLVLIAVPTIWAGGTETSTLATVLLVLGWFVLVISVPALVLFPRVYMAIAEAVLPAETHTDMFGWRLLGLLGFVIGIGLFWFGWLAL